MSASSDLQKAIAAHLGASRSVDVDGVPTQVPWLRVKVPIVSRREKDLAAEIEAAHDKGIGVYVMPPLPTRAMQGVPFVFFEGAEVRVRIIEQPAVNETGADAYDLIDDVATALQWQPHRAIEEAVHLKMQTDQIDQQTALALVQADPANTNLFAMAAMLAHPLQLSSRPVEMAEDPRSRIIDVIFEATYQLNPAIPE